LCNEKRLMKLYYYYYHLYRKYSIYFVGMRFIWIYAPKKVRYNTYNSSIFLGGEYLRTWRELFVMRVKLLTRRQREVIAFCSSKKILAIISLACLFYSACKTGSDVRTSTSFPTHTTFPRTGRSQNHRLCLSDRSKLPIRQIQPSQGQVGYRNKEFLSVWQMRQVSFLSYCAAGFALLNLPKGKSLGRSKPATNSSNEQAH